ncbi:WDR73-like protein [Mya arenaria]|uniref:WDR73-like protein n=1 Tax=Mya arenaria TaxID=6604 RepID=A0ABY7ERG6_MYAAR|nr:WDR73-like protein [Mya arenaria]
MDYDDWLFESIRRYDKLSMYHINGLVTATDWVNAKGMLVATDSGTSSKHELMELHLPDKIIDDDISLSKDRDFRVASGCFTDRKVNCVRHIPGTRNCVLAKDGTAAIEMYEMGDNSSNLIKPAPGRSNNDGRKFSISGFDGNVYVYQMVDQHCRLEFVHDGHVMNRDDQTESISVLQHVWFPDSQDQVVSMATDGSLHAWKHR